jgi:hypothetical protein
VNILTSDILNVYGFYATEKNCTTAKIFVSPKFWFNFALYRQAFRFSFICFLTIQYHGISWELYLLASVMDCMSCLIVRFVEPNSYYAH